MNESKDRLTRLLATKRALLLDFDGPVCSIFSSYPAPIIAKELRAKIRRHGLDMPIELLEADDPLAVFRLIDTWGPTLLSRAIEEALRSAETAAASKAAPTPGGHDVIRAAVAAGQRVAIVSNNANEAIRTYLQRHRLLGLIDAVEGRYSGMPASYLKPHPHLVLRALRALGTTANDAVLLGDSATDIHAAREARVATIGYGHGAEKSRLLNAARADVLVGSMTVVAECYSRLN